VWMMAAVVWGMVTCLLMVADLVTLAMTTMMMIMTMTTATAAATATTTTSMVNGGTAGGSRDLKESATHTPEDATRYLELAYSSANAFADLPMPTIAAINGPCFGWGLEAAMACDIRMAVTEAKICFPECRLGIFPGAGGVARLCKQVPMACAKMMVLSARVMSGAEAVRVRCLVESIGSSPYSLFQCRTLHT
jgi:1,4-dihydroxy-2-naphthoyl-CoA synthase